MLSDSKKNRLEKGGLESFVHKAAIFNRQPHNVKVQVPCKKLLAVNLIVSDPDRNVEKLPQCRASLYGNAQGSQPCGVTAVDGLLLKPFCRVVFAHSSAAAI